MIPPRTKLITIPPFQMHYLGLWRSTEVFEHNQYKIYYCPWDKIYTISFKEIQVKGQYKDITTVINLIENCEMNNENIHNLVQELEFPYSTLNILTPIENIKNMIYI